MSDPFRIEGPAVLSVSGGRSSAYMLWRVLQAHGGALPADVVAVFANTGKEREETLEFVHACAQHWSVPIAWVEFRARRSIEVVDFERASRKGEPFDALIEQRQFVPNPLRRFCTEELKVNTIRWFIEQTLGWTSWRNVVGLRADEGHRLLKAYARNAQGGAPWTSVRPFDKGQVMKRDVRAFWNEQPFDLKLRGDESNCDLCFLKRPPILKTLMHERPEAAAWWIEKERQVGAQFNVRESYAAMADEASRQMHLFTIDQDVEADEECGLICAGEDAT